MYETGAFERRQGVLGPDRCGFTTKRLGQLVGREEVGRRVAYK